MVTPELSIPAVVTAIVVSYALGCIPGAQIVARRHGIDLRRTSDGNPGAWNALEQLGWRRAWPAFLIDGLKGALAAIAGWLAIADAPWDGGGGLLQAGELVIQPVPDHWVPWLCVGAAMLGHALPLPHPREGGKSVMTFAGGAIALVPLIGAPLTAAFVAAVVAGQAALGARIVVTTFPALQALVTPLTQVGWTGLLMTVIGGAMLLRRGDRRRGG